MLTPKQEKYVQNLVKGMSQRKAYKNAFPESEKWKDTTIDNRASELFKKDEILGRYNELVKKADDEAIMSARERMLWLSRVVNGDEKDTVYLSVNGKNTPIQKTADINTKIKALDTLNKMTGEYTTKVEGTITALQKDMNAVNDIASQMSNVSEDDIDVST